MNNIRIRPAKKEEAVILAQLIVQAGDGLVEFLLTDLVPNLSPLQLMQHQIAEEDLPYSYLTTAVAVLNNQVVGAAQYYSSEFLRIANASDDSFIPYERINHLLNPMHRPCPKNTLYLNAIGVLPAYQGKGIGKQLLDHVKNEAQEKNQDVILHAWKDNTRAIALYEREGFTVIDTIDIKKHPMINHEGGMVLMRYHHA